MDSSVLPPALVQLRLNGINIYLWRDDDGVTLVDAGPFGSGPLIAEALAAFGAGPGDVRRLVLTHFHDDHAGGAAEVASWGAVTVVAGRADADLVRGTAVRPEPPLTPAEQALLAVVAADLPPAPPCRVDQEVDDGDVLPFGGGAVVLAVPGHTGGSIALHLPDHDLLFTGDTVGEQQGQLVLGPFNLDRDLSWRSLHRLAAVGAGQACFGHGEPVTSEAAARIAAATDPFGEPGSDGTGATAG